jgi:hypothetical protein
LLLGSIAYRDKKVVGVFCAFFRTPLQELSIGSAVSETLV